MDYYMIILRIIHIVFAVTWAGATIVMTSFIGPTAKAVGDDAKPFMQYFSTRSPFSPAIMGSALLTVLSGTLMYYEIFGDRFPLHTLTIGALFGWVAFFIGYFKLYKNIQRMKAIGAVIATAGGPPTADQLAELSTIQESSIKWGGINTLVISGAMIFMSLNGYLFF